MKDSKMPNVDEDGFTTVGRKNMPPAHVTKPGLGGGVQNKNFFNSSNQNFNKKKFVVKQSPNTSGNERGINQNKRNLDSVSKSQVNMRGNDDDPMNVGQNTNSQVKKPATKH
ncbi:hypothetical protein Tco_0507158, partial [Tanacetum coccineum]